MSGTASAGKAGEGIAEAYLCERGATLLERNYRAAGGEVDLIVEMGGAIVFVEVKRRTSGRYGTGAEAVNLPKQRRISQAALAYLKQHKRMDSRCRFDVIEIMGNEIRHIPSAFLFAGRGG